MKVGGVVDKIKIALTDKLEIKSGAEVIDVHAFSGNTRLTEVKLPNTIKEIKNYAFMGCENLRYINIPDSVETIGIGVFSECTKLKNVIMSKEQAMKFKWCFLETPWFSEYMREHEDRLER
jgi:hypothetical protein